MEESDVIDRYQSHATCAVAFAVVIVDMMIQVWNAPMFGVFC
jgi:hypothetical protein